MVYAVLETAFTYDDKTVPRAIPFSMGTMTGAQAARLTEEEILEEAAAALIGVDAEDMNVVGIVQGKPNAQREGKRIRKRRGPKARRGTRKRRVRGDG